MVLSYMTYITIYGFSKGVVDHVKLIDSDWSVSKEERSYLGKL